MKKIYRAFEKKEGKKYIETFRSEDIDSIYKAFATELMYCKIWKSPVYKRMTDVNNYDGTRTVTFFQEYGKSIYCIEI